MKRSLPFLLASTILAASVADLAWRPAPPPERLVALEAASFDDGSGTARPLLVFLGGSEGGVPRSRALVQTFLDGGFDIGLLGYQGFDGGPRTLSEIEVGAVADGIETLRRVTGDEETCTAVLGISKGAELALLLATERDVGGAYVAVVPPHVVWQSPEVTLRIRSSFVLDGEPVPFLRYPWFSTATVRGVFAPLESRPLAERALRDTEAAARAAIRIERSSDPVLLQGAARDQTWSSDVSARLLATRAPGKRVQAIIYDADHFLMSHPPARRDAVRFLKEALLARCFASAAMMTQPADP